jgi:rSAM/selenodomain-associated transferase 2
MTGMNDDNEIISIVMPVLNEAGSLRERLRALELGEGEELLVVDGGSTDGTVAMAGEFASRVLAGPRGRAVQMNLGARESSGGILFFLHADCTPPPGAFGIIRNALSDPSVAAGAFDLSVDHPSPWFRLIESVASLRSRITGVPYGDQGLFMRKYIFERIGGFSEIPLMEDVEIAGRLGRLGRIAFLQPPVRAAPRRWLAEGLIHTTLRDWAIALAYTVFGVSPKRLARYYRDVR